MFVWIGAVSFVPGERLPFGLGLLGIGMILLGINLVRRAIPALPVNGTDITLGTIALALGAAELFRSLVLIPIGLSAIGLVLLIRSGLPRKTAAGKLVAKQIRGFLTVIASVGESPPNMAYLDSSS